LIGKPSDEEEKVLAFSVTFLITIVNITFLYLILRKVLFGPVTKFMEARTNKIHKDLEMAKLATQRADALEAEFKEKMKLAREEGEKIIQIAREKAEHEYAVILAKAKADAEKTVANSRLALDEERRVAESFLRNETAEISIKAASKIIEENLDTDKNRKLVEKFIESAGVA